MVGGGMEVGTAWRLEYGQEEPESSCGSLEMCYRYVLVGTEEP